MQNSIHQKVRLTSAQSDREALEAVREFDRACEEHARQEHARLIGPSEDYQASFSQVVTPVDFLPDWEPDPVAELRVALRIERGFQLQARRARIRTHARRVIPRLPRAMRG